ncbi:hypothetical protein D3C84_864130 [compost metagenome]
MICEPCRQRDVRQQRISRSEAGKDARVRNVQPFDAVYSAVPVSCGCERVIAHAASAVVVIIEPWRPEAVTPWILDTHRGRYIT